METKFTISAIRRNMGLTQEELADKLGISRATMINLEKNPKKAEFGTIIEISQLSGVPLNYINYDAQS